MWHLILIFPLIGDVFLLMIFASGFLPGRTPILTTVAAMARNHPLDAKTVAYTRTITLVWAVCAGLLAALQAGGLLLADLRGLATSAAFCQTPIFLVLLVGEYLLRRRYLNHLPHMSFLEFVRFLRRIDYAAALRNG